MAGRTVYIYIAVVCTFLPIIVQTETCTDSVDHIDLDGVCYRKYDTPKSWTEATDDCKQWNGKLATFSSENHMLQAFKALNFRYTPVWVGAYGEPKGQEFHWAASYQKKAMVVWVYFEDCQFIIMPSICMRINNNISTLDPNDPTLTFRSNATTNLDLESGDWTLAATKTDTCSHKDAIRIDGKCYVLSPENLNLSDAHSYCNTWNGVIATFSSAEHGINVLTTMNLFKGEGVWAIDTFKSDDVGFISLELKEGCKKYTYGPLMYDSLRLRALCMEVPPTSATALESTSWPGPTTASSLTTTPEFVSTPESTTKATLGSTP